MTESELKRTLQKFIMCSYLYYILFESVVPDEEYDKMAKDLLDGWHDFEHQHKHLLSKEALKAGTMYHLGEGQYPGMAIGGAMKWLEDFNIGKGAGE